MKILLWFLLAILLVLAGCASGNSLAFQPARLVPGPAAAGTSPPTSAANQSPRPWGNYHLLFYQIASF